MNNQEKINELKAQLIENPSSNKAKQHNKEILSQLKELGHKRGIIKDSDGFSIYEVLGVKFLQWVKTKGYYIELKCRVQYHDGNEGTRYVRVNLEVDQKMKGLYAGVDTPLVNLLKVLGWGDDEFVSRASEILGDCEVESSKFAKKYGAGQAGKADPEQYRADKDALELVQSKRDELGTEIGSHIFNAFNNPENDKVLFKHQSKLDCENETSHKVEFRPWDYEPVVSNDLKSVSFSRE